MTFNQVTNLLDASKEERQRFLDSFDLILTDCDGTLWHFHSTIDGVGAGVKALQDKGKRIVYSSNNATRSADIYEEQFVTSGIKATFEDVMHPGIAAVDYFRQTNFNGLIYLIGSENLKQLIEKAGFEVFDGPTEVIEENFSALFAAIADDRPVRAVIIDWDFNLTLQKIIRAQLYLLNADCAFLVCATDMELPTKIPILGPGPFYKMLEQKTGRSATVVGKPGIPLKDIVMKKYNVTEPARVLFIGDSLESDIAFGKVCGFQTLAVLTGSATRIAIATTTNENQVPDYFLPSFADFVAVCEDLHGPD